MKYNLLIIFLVLSSQIYSQQLNVNQTINYINDNLKYGFELALDDEGLFTISDKKSSVKIGDKINLSQFNLMGDTHTQNSRESTFRGELKLLGLEKSLSYSNDFLIKFKCSKGTPCIKVDKYKLKATVKNDKVIDVNKYWEIHDSGNKYNFELRFSNEKNRNKIYNAFKYLIGLVKEDPKYQIVDDDPFADENFKSTYSYITGIKSKEEISLEKQSGIYYIKIEINGISKRFVLDSGASEISLSSELEKEFISRGILTKESYIEPALYRIADGSIVAKRRVVLKEIKVGEYIVNNVTASVGSSNIPLLLGKSFLDKFSKWTIDNETEKLILEK